MRNREPHFAKNYVTNTFLFLSFVLWISFLSACFADGLHLSADERKSILYSRELREPATIGPRFSDELNAFVTEIELHVQLRRMSVPLFTNETPASTNTSDESTMYEFRSHPSHLFTYTGRVYDVVRTSEDFRDSDDRKLLRSYVPGPTLRVVPGGYLRFKLVNDLEGRDTVQKESSANKTAENSSSTEAFCSNKWPFHSRMFYTMHHPNITNMHFHGLHCDPFIDNPFLTVLPRLSVETDVQGQNKDKLANEHEYLVPVPPNHAPGLHWYHAHSHGSVYFQLMGGLFGALIVDEQPYGESNSSNVKGSLTLKQKERTSPSFPRRPWLASTTPSRLLVFHLYRLRSFETSNDCDGPTMDELDQTIHNTLQPSFPKIDPFDSAATMGSTRKDSLSVAPNLFLVNGQHRPVIAIEEGQPTTLRMLYAAGSCHLNLSFPCTSEASSCSPFLATGAPQSGSVHRCFVVPGSADGVPFDLSMKENFSSVLNSSSHHSTFEPLASSSSSFFPSSTSWLYFTTATRYEVVVICNRTTFVNEVEAQALTPKEGFVYPVRNQVNDTVFFVQILPKKHGNNSDKYLIRNSTDAGRATKTARIEGHNSIISNISIPQVMKESSKALHTVDLNSLFFSNPRRRDLKHHNDPNYSKENRYTSEPLGYLNLPSLGKHAEIHQHQKMLNSSQFSDSSLPFRWDLSLSQSYVIDSSIYKTCNTRPFYVIGEGSDCSEDSSRLFLDEEHLAIGDSAKIRTKKREKDATNSSCYFHPFEGPRGSENLSAYHGFVVPYDGIVEAHIFGDTTDIIPHPFHFHVNHFQFLSFRPRPGGLHKEYTDNLRSFGLFPGQWRDTIPILDGETVVRWRAANFSGEIVYHCHMLKHEDEGMMSSYFVLPPDTGTKNVPKFDVSRWRVTLHLYSFPFFIAATALLFIFILLGRKWCWNHSQSFQLQNTNGVNGESSGLRSSGWHRTYGTIEPQM